MILFIHYKLLKPVSSLLRSRVQSDVVESSLTWKDKLEKAVLEIPLRFKANLQNQLFQCQNFLELKKEIQLNINVDETVDFYVSNQKYFLAEMGEVKGNACRKINQKIKITKEKK